MSQSYNDPIVDVGDFHCHLCKSGNRDRLGPVTVKIGNVMQTAVYLCVECQGGLRDVVRKHLNHPVQSRPKQPDEPEQGRNIIV